MTIEEQEERAVRLAERGHSLRAIGDALGFSRTTAATRLSDYEQRTGERVKRPSREARRRSRDSVWMDRMRPAMGRPLEWVEVHSMPYDSAVSSVTKLRAGPLSITEGGEWQFRTVRGGEGGIGIVLARWNGTACTGCGALSPVETTCPLCGCDKRGE